MLKLKETLEAADEALASRLGELYRAFTTAGDEKNCRKLGQLMEKLESAEFTIALCGHFSAGKSSLINSIVGSEILPSSPIPTSANLVKIKPGPPAARVYLKHSRPVEFDFSANLEELKSYCADGDTVDSIEITHPFKFLDSDNVSIMDTPGIDSTDDAHKVATESALHLADLILYVTDYNHVQSELNFNFTKTLKDRGKLVFLVVNQIDKHSEFELDFGSYKSGVEEAFNAWHIQLDGLFFTTLKEDHHPDNQIQALKRAVRKLLSEQESLLAKTVVQSTLQLVADHGKWQSAANAEQKAKYREILDRVEDAGAAVGEYQGLKQRQDELLALPEALEGELKKELGTLLENAPLTPYQTTELARQYMESRQPGFKVGFLFSGSKTKQEMEKRLESLYADLAQRVSASIDWHLKEILAKVPETYGLSDEEYLQSVYRLKVDFGPELLVRQFKEGATGREYVHNYTRDVANEVKSLYRRAALSLQEDCLVRAKKSVETELSIIREKLTGLAEVVGALEGLQGLVQAERACLDGLVETLTGRAMSLEEARLWADSQAAHSLQQVKEQLRGESNEPAKPEGLIKPDGLTKFAGLPASVVPLKGNPQEGNPHSGASRYSHSHLKDYKALLGLTGQKLRTAAREIQNIPGLASAARAMVGRAERLEANLFTVALFGAFSAGKSSFANALMDNMVLPVSPNPTTATINKILPPTGIFSHGSVRVKFKTLAQITSDVVHSLSIFGQQVTGLEEALGLIPKLHQEEVQPSAKPHFTFLRAVLKGIEQVRECLGSEILVDLQAFQEFVVREEKACFVEWIELYYSCPLTDQGITLVDTPGADSINARHTGVAFEYIKNADAVLFVTYYNHAFSNADREFLIQLGRVKDALEMDKMFFIVNACDLAQSREELDGVIEHVSNNLVSYGVRMPRIYPVSSQVALLARMYEQGNLQPAAEKVYRQRTGVPEGGPLMEPAEALELSGIAAFEKDFLTFTIEELTQVAVQAAMKEILRSCTNLEELISSAREGETVRAARLQSATKARETALKSSLSVEVSSEEQSIHKEIDELVYYVKQRVMHRFPGAFNECFNPVALKEDGRNMKQVLRWGLEELLRFIAYDLAQEMRATALRVENFLNKSAARVLRKMEEAIGRTAPHCSLEPFQPAKPATPELPEELKGTGSPEFTKVLSLFKNAGHFFEKNGKAVMRDRLESLLQGPVNLYLEDCTGILRAYYLQAYKNLVETMKADVEAQVQEYFQGLMAALSMQVDIDELVTVRSKLQQLLAD